MAQAATKALSRLAALVVVLVLAVLAAAGASVRLPALAVPMLGALNSDGGAAALISVLTPALAGLTGAVLVSQARQRSAGEARLLRLLPGAHRFLDAHPIGRAARLFQVICVGGLAMAGVAIVWLLSGAASSPDPNLTSAEIVCVVLAVLAYPLLIGERVLASTHPSDLPEAADLRSLLLIAVAGLPATGLLLLLLAGGIALARPGLLLVTGLGVLVSGELAVRALLRSFLPAPAEDAARAACHSLIATLLADGSRPGGLGGSIRRNLGIDFARSWALSFVRAAVPPVVLGLAVLTWGLTGLIVVGPDQRAIVERFGEPAAVLHPGAHLALPWPATRVRLLDNGVTREISLSGDRATSTARSARADDREVPEADRLWEEEHATERLFLIASATGDAQSFQAMGADIRLIWQIGASDADALRFTYSTSNPERLLVAIAGHALTDAFASETLESVLGENRAVLAANIARTIQGGADRAELGIRLVAVVIEAMHPPTGAAAAFHAVQAAELDAQTAVAAERGNAVVAGAQAQTWALQAAASASANAAETRAAAAVALTGFQADQAASQVGGATFTFERYLSNLIAVSSRTSLTIIDHRVAAAQAPTIDLRLSGATGLNGQ